MSLNSASFCSDCRYFVRHRDGCDNPTMVEIDPVHGPLLGNARALRAEGNKCGPEATGFTPPSRISIPAYVKIAYFALGLSALAYLFWISQHRPLG